MVNDNLTMKTYPRRPYTAVEAATRVRHVIALALVQILGAVVRQHTQVDDLLQQ